MIIITMLIWIISSLLLAGTTKAHTLQKRILLLNPLNPSTTSTTSTSPKTSSSHNSASFGPGKILGTIADGDIDEASGCAASRIHPGILYTLNDHGGDNEVYALATNGSLIATLTISGSDNQDWEDLAVAPCTDSPDHVEYCIYIADTGDSRHEDKDPYTIYKVKEPVSLHDQHIHGVSKLEFSWHEDDCETLMVDPHANIYIVSKEDDGEGKIFKIPYSAWGRSHYSISSHTGVQIGAPSTHHDPVAGSISPDGREVLIKTHEQVFYWNMDGSAGYVGELHKSGRSVPYQQELKGESVCWDPTGSGYYTMSEGKHQPIYYYKRL